jgi:hypothetical protein
MAYLITWYDKGVSVDFDGDVSTDEINKAGQCLYDDPRFAECRYQLFNFETADLSGIALEEISDTVQRDTEASSKYPSPSLAIVSRQASADALMFHYKLAAESSNLRWEIKIFRKSEEAYAWCRTISEHIAC